LLLSTLLQPVNGLYFSLQIEENVDENHGENGEPRIAARGRRREKKK